MNDVTTNSLAKNNSVSTQLTSFSIDVRNGLLTSPKKLQSKYFYDKKGDRLFQEIMNCAEYYPTNCEMEILSEQSDSIVNYLKEKLCHFDIFELGPGDASKSIHLLKALQSAALDFTYYPIDISENVIDNLESVLPEEVPGLQVKGLNGDFLHMLKSGIIDSSSQKVVLFLGSNIGNMHRNEAGQFCKEVFAMLNPGDIFFIGIDLKKDPNTILAAYNDKEGLTKAFNLNLLARINKELGANFDLEQFEHFPTYNPQTGECNSYLVSKKEQSIHLKTSDDHIHFHENEAIFMETSIKYSLKETEKMAEHAGFTVLNHYFDTKGWFVDSLWQKPI